MNFQVISYQGRDSNYDQAGMVGLQWSLLSRTQYKVHDLLVHHECPPALWGTNAAIQLFDSNTISTPPQHPSGAPGRPAKASYQNDIWYQCNGEKLIFQGIGIDILARANLPQSWCNQSVWWVVDLGWCRMQCPYQSEENWSLLEAISAKNRVAQLECIQ